MPRERDSTAEGQDEILRRLGKLEGWVEAVMRMIMSLDVESVLTELDEARGAGFDEADQS
jgi:DNA-binding FrmR family transcriptional regulator